MSDFVSIGYSKPERLTNIAMSTLNDLKQICPKHIWGLRYSPSWCYKFGLSKWYILSSIYFLICIGTRTNNRFLEVSIVFIRFRLFYIRHSNRLIKNEYRYQALIWPELTKIDFSKSSIDTRLWYCQNRVKRVILLLSPITIAFRYHDWRRREKRRGVNVV